MVLKCSNVGILMCIVRKHMDIHGYPNIQRVWIWRDTKFGVYIKSIYHAINDVFYVDGLQHNLLSISQLCNKGNKVEFKEDLFHKVNAQTNELVC